MQEEKKGNKTIWDFDGIGDVVEFSNSNSVWDESSSSRRNREDPNFVNGTYEDAIEQAKFGNPDLVKVMYDGVEVLNAMIEKDWVAFSRDVTGEFFDVGDFLTGEPECWWRDDELAGRRQVIPVYASISMDCNVTQEQIRNRGCAIVALCDILQQNGFIVDLKIVSGIGYSNKKCYMRFNVQNNPIDLDMAAFMIANPLFFRRICLSLIEMWTEEPSPWGYGHPIEYDLDDLFQDGVSGFYFCSSAHRIFRRCSNYGTLEDAKNHIFDMISEFQKNEKQVVIG